ncbi:sensor histidine kinase [Mobiluncus sp.]|uniref:sensor histidine kinase n=1 Tax=Mobiluncus sp. TaxID=47293 RepID=UPI002A91E681|nr:sensor histidine kinase [Mobiluncus sp.]MDY6077704.1 sensor histidine kinase [Mobiluncus sp.]
MNPKSFHDLTAESRDLASSPSKPDMIVGTFMSLVWLGFLYFPISQALTLPLGSRVASLILTATFALAYVTAFILAWRKPIMGERNFRYFDGRHRLRKSDAVAFAVIVTITLLQMAVLGPLASLAFLPFIAAAAPFTLPQAAGYIAGALTVLASFLIPSFVPNGQEYFGFAITTSAVFMFVAGTTFFIGSSIESQRQVGTQAILEERERVARDVHDVLGHTLTVIALKSELAGKLLERDPGRAQAELREITHLARESIEEVRQTVAGLKVQSLFEEITAASQALESAGIDLQREGNAWKDLDSIPAVNQAVFAWVIREATTNIIRHAAARRATIKLDRSSLTITDNGVGISPEAAGHGLEGLKARVEQVGGTLSIVGKRGVASTESAANERQNALETGTVVEVKL